MIIKAMVVLQQEVGESKSDFLEKVTEYEEAGYKFFNGLCYDRENELAEVTLTLNFDLQKSGKVENLFSVDEDTYLN